MKSLVLLVSFWMLSACVTTPPADSIPEPKVLPDSELCEPMCAHLAELKCPQAETLYNNDLPGPPDVPNQTCGMFCREMLSNGVPMNPKCVMLVKSCEEIEPARTKDPTTCG